MLVLLKLHSPAMQLLTLFLIIFFTLSLPYPTAVDQSDRGDASVPFEMQLPLKAPVAFTFAQFKKIYSKKY